jgi:hypothetical protein
MVVKSIGLTWLIEHSILIFKCFEADMVNGYEVWIVQQLKDDENGCTKGSIIGDTVEREDMLGLMNQQKTLGSWWLWYIGLGASRISRRG